MMERLTNHEMDNYNEPGCDLCSAYCYEMCKIDDAVKDCAKRLRNICLAAYEDACYDNEGNEIITPEEVAELAQAKKEARLVVLPCKVGSELYDFGEFFDGHKSPEMYLIDAKEITISEDNGEIIFNIDCNRLRYKDFGETVFLTREAAQAALEVQEEQSK